MSADSGCLTDWRPRAKRPMGVRMPPQQTRRIMRDYFNAMEKGRFAQFLIDNVTCTTIDTNAVVQGPHAVQDFIVGRHARMSDMQTHRLIFSGRLRIPRGQLRWGGGTNGPDFLLRRIRPDRLADFGDARVRRCRPVSPYRLSRVTVRYPTALVGPNLINLQHTDPRVASIKPLLRAEQTPFEPLLAGAPWRAGCCDA
jgi:hypothetical protein